MQLPLKYKWNVFGVKIWGAAIVKKVHFPRRNGPNIQNMCQIYPDDDCQEPFQLKVEPHEGNTDLPTSQPENIAKKRSRDHVFLVAGPRGE
jgi:hypothetical protein